jgi:hypothetical protein
VARHFGTAVWLTSRDISKVLPTEEVIRRR